jgi:hypothetical protein
MKWTCITLLWLAAMGGSAAGDETFTLSVDRAQWAKWGFRYPVTFVFDVTGLTPEVGAARRDVGSAWWSRLQENTAEEFFNGVEAVRFDPAASKAYVSVGFHDEPRMELQIRGVASAKFASVAPYYDNRKAAYTLSIDNWGRTPSANPNAPWKGEADDASDKYQAALHVCRSFHLPLSIAINTQMAGGGACWRHMQEELDRGDDSWEPAVHAQSHPQNGSDYGPRGYRDEILGCRADILKQLRGIPYGGRIYEHILTCGYVDDAILRMDAGEFLFVRGYNAIDNPRSVTWADRRREGGYYGVGGLSTIAYDRVLETRKPKGRFYAADVAELNHAFDAVVRDGRIFYAMWHPDRYSNSAVYDLRPGVDGESGSTLIQHLAHVANRKDVWYVANGWMYSYRYVAEHVTVAAGRK